APRCPISAHADSLVDPAFYSRGVPHALWADIRRDSPVARQTLSDGHAFWSVTSYREAAEVLQDATAFTSERGALLEQLGRDDPAGGIQLVATDPPHHDALRAPLQRALAAKPVSAMRERLRAIVLDTLAPMADHKSYDLAEHVRRLAVGV